MRSSKFRAAIVCAATSVCIPAFAQTGPALEEVVVTARKRAESAQETPIAVTAFSADELQRAGVSSFVALSNNNPNVKINTGASGGAAISTTVAIRGNVQNDTLAQLDASVGTYVDGFVIAHTYAMEGVFLDTESVQTLKGPQGTLFGRNTTGGAILIKTRDPEIGGDFSGYVKATVGSYDTQEYTGAVNIPLGDRVALRFAAQHKTNDGYAEQVNGAEWGDKESDTFRGKLMWELTDATTLLLSAERVDVEGTSTVNFATQPNRPRYDDIPLEAFGPVPLILTDERNEATATTFNLTFAQDISWGEVKFMAGRRDLEIDKNQTLPPLSGYTTLQWPDYTQDTYELQVNGSFLDDRLKVTSGLYHYNADAHQSEIAFFPNGTLQTGSDVDIDMESSSVYAQATYALLDNLNVTAGGRYTDDKREVTGTFLVAPGTWSLAPSENKFNYLLSLDYHVTENAMLYLANATGYRSGTAVIAPNAARPGEWLELVPEEVTNYEVGLKSDWLDGRLRVNSALFLQDYKDYQYSRIVFQNGGVQRDVQNTDAEIFGGELEVSALLPADLRFTFSYGYTDAHETNSPAEQSLPNVPENTYGASLVRAFDVVGGKLELTANYSWQDEIYNQFDNPAASVVDAYGLLNLSVQFSRDKWTVNAFVNNATDEAYYTNITYFNLPAVNPAPVPLLSMGNLGTPRIVGVGVTYDF